MNIILDLITTTYTKYNLCTYLYHIKDYKLNTLIQTLILLYIINENIIIILKFIIIYIIYKVIFKYIKRNIFNILILYTLFYLIIFNDINISYLINIIYVIIIYFSKYNLLGEKHEKIHE